MTLAKVTPAAGQSTASRDDRKTALQSEPLGSRSARRCASGQHLKVPRTILRQQVHRARQRLQVRVAGGESSALGTDHDEQLIEYISPESPDGDEEDLASYYNDMPFDGADHKVLGLEDLIELKDEGIRMGLDKVQAAGPEV